MRFIVQLILLILIHLGFATAIFAQIDSSAEQFNCSEAQDILRQLKSAQQT